MAWTYIVTNKPNGTLYVGVTNDLVRRIHEHRTGIVEGFSKRYRLDRLVYFEQHHTVPLAIQREKNMKRWPRAWKARLINENNREWRDLYEGLFEGVDARHLMSGLPDISLFKCRSRQKPTSDAGHDELTS